MPGRPMEHPGLTLPSVYPWWLTRGRGLSLSILPSSSQRDVRRGWPERCLPTSRSTARGTSPLVVQSSEEARRRLVCPLWQTHVRLAKLLTALQR